MDLTNRMYDNLWNNNHYEKMYTLHDISVEKLLLYNQSQGLIGKINSRTTQYFVYI